MTRFGIQTVTFALCLLLLSGCARDDSATLKLRLSQWFELGDQVSFRSRMRCTAAVFDVTAPEPRPGLSVQRQIDVARRQFRMGRLGAIQMANFSPNDLSDALLLSGDGTFGKQALAAVAQAGPCFQDTEAERFLRNAFTRKGATLVYDRQSEGVIVLDPFAMVVVYVAGDVW